MIQMDMLVVLFDPDLSRMYLTLAVDTILCFQYQVIILDGPEEMKLSLVVDPLCLYAWRTPG
jgi:hypothetical protein